MTTERREVPDLLLEQYALGELSRAESAAVDAALAADPALRGRLARLRASDQAILREAPPAQVAAAIRDRMVSGSPRVFRPAQAVFLPAAAALLVLVGGLMFRNLLFPDPGDLTRPKGGAPGLFVFRKTAAGVEQLRDGTGAAAGDMLQVRYGAAGSRHGAVYSLDGRGALTRHLPAAGPAATRASLLAEGGATLDSAYELDDAPGFERFLILSSAADFDLLAVEAALRALAASGSGAATEAPRLPAGIEWKSFLLRKPGAAR